MSATIKRGDIVRIKPEWRDPGDERFIWRALEDEDGGRVKICATNTGLTFPPNQIVNVSMLEMDQPIHGSPVTDEEMAQENARLLAQHTPGPWHAMPFNGGETIYADDNHRVAECLATGKHGEKHEANARLIAAAPELLNMLQRMIDETGGGCAPCELTREHARAAITKATGGGL